MSRSIVKISNAEGINGEEKLLKLCRLIFPENLRIRSSIVKKLNTLPSHFGVLNNVIND